MRALWIEMIQSEMDLTKLWSRPVRALWIEMVVEVA